MEYIASGCNEVEARAVLRNSSRILGRAVLSCIYVGIRYLFRNGVMLLDTHVDSTIKPGIKYRQ